MKKIIVFGSTGSIGENTLDVVRKNKNSISICGLSTKKNIELLQKQIDEFCPSAVSVWDKNKAEELKKKVGNKVKVYTGLEGLLTLANMQADLIVSALVGAVGLRPLLEAIKSGKNIALANKEVLVMAGAALMTEAVKSGVSIIPVDSEHSALMQCLWKRDSKEIKRIFLTASGGPFYNKQTIDLNNISPEEALAHPTWQMGQKVTIDSATLLNKGFEVIEASVLFGISMDKIEVVIHPESIVHAMVEFIDGSVTALMHIPDMRVPIQYALSWPHRWTGDYGTLDLTRLGSLRFSKPDMQKFPALNLAYKAGKIGGTMPVVLSAADEVCVEYFLANKIKFMDIISIIKNVMDKHDIIIRPSLEDIFNADEWARSKTIEFINADVIDTVKGV